MLRRINDLIVKSSLILLFGGTSTIGLSGTPLVGDGNPINFSELGIRMTVPSGWQILPLKEGKSLILRESKSSRTPRDEKEAFHRQISASLTYETVAIDEQQIARLRAELLASYADEDQSTVQISDDMKFFNYRGENDGIIAYSFQKKDGLSLTHMHILLSGDMNRVLLTSTEMTEQFDANMEQAWNAMTSIEITGPAPDFVAKWKPVFIGVASMLGFLMLLSMVRRFRVKRWLRLADAEDENFSDQANTPSRNKVAPKLNNLDTPPIPFSHSVPAREKITKKSVSVARVAQKTANLPPPPVNAGSRGKVPSTSRSSAKDKTAVSKQLTPPPMQEAVARFYDANLEDDWQWVSGQDDIF